MLDELYQLCKNPPSEKDWNRFWVKVKLGADDECWIWQAGKNADGYGIFDYEGKSTRAHRLFYFWFFNTSQATGLVLDHLCRNRACINLSHLRLCPIRDNALRGINSPSALNAQKLLCKRGHPLTPRTRHFKNAVKKYRRCLICSKEDKRRARAKRKLIIALI